MIQPTPKLKRFLDQALKRQASDLHLLANLPPTVRIDGELFLLPEEKNLLPQEIEEMVFSICTEEQKEIISTNLELDFSFDLPGEARFRINAYHQKGTLAASLRVIPKAIQSIDELSLPSICHDFIKIKQGFVLVTGPTGHGKSTTIAAMLEEINQKKKCHIVTVEDPVEFTFEPKEAIISQREINRDTHSWDLALRSCLREDPNVVFVGEMRDLETIAAALTIAETGHLVFSTLHTNSAAQTVDRIVDIFPEGAKEQVRIQFSQVLEGVISQRLVPALGGGRLPVCEVMTGSVAIKTAIREGKSHLIDNVIQTSQEAGMVNLETSLAKLVNEGKVSLETAQAYALRPRELMRQVGR